MLLCWEKNANHTQHFTNTFKAMGLGIFKYKFRISSSSSYWDLLF